MTLIEILTISVAANLSVHQTQMKKPETPIGSTRLATLGMNYKQQKPHALLQSILEIPLTFTKYKNRYTPSNPQKQKKQKTKNEIQNILMQH